MLTVLTYLIICLLYQRNRWSHTVHNMVFIQDPVPNVRLSVSYLLPNVKRSLKLPSDRILLQQLDQTVRKLYSLEHDTDVSHTVRLTLPELNRIEVAVETVSVYYRVCMYK